MATASEFRAGRELRRVQAVEFGACPDCAAHTGCVGEAWTPIPRPEATLRSEFNAHVEKWRRATLHTSSLERMLSHASYRRIMGMGREVLPFLLKELSERPDHWLVALNAISGEDPAPNGCSFDEAVKAWLTWGRQRGYLK